MVRDMERGRITLGDGIGNGEGVGRGDRGLGVRRLGEEPRDRIGIGQRNMYLQTSFLFSLR